MSSQDNEGKMDPMAAVYAAVGDGAKLEKAQREQADISAPDAVMSDANAGLSGYLSLDLASGSDSYAIAGPLLTIAEPGEENMFGIGCADIADLGNLTDTVTGTTVPYDPTHLTWAAITTISTTRRLLNDQQIEEIVAMAKAFHQQDSEEAAESELRRHLQNLSERVQ